MQFDFVFRIPYRPLFLSLSRLLSLSSESPLSFFLPHDLSPARRSKFYGPYFLFNADAVSNRFYSPLCPPFTPFCSLPLSLTFRLRLPAFLRAIVSRANFAMLHGPEISGIIASLSLSLSLSPSLPLSPLRGKSGPSPDQIYRLFIIGRI